MNQVVTVSVMSIHIPAMSTLGYGEGILVDESGSYHVRFAGDHRPMRDIGEALRDAKAPVNAEIAPHLILAMTLIEGAQA